MPRPLLLCKVARREGRAVHLILHVDGTVVTVYAPSDSRLAKAMYSHKHEHHGWQFFIVVSQTGRIVFLSTIEVFPSSHTHSHTHTLSLSLIGSVIQVDNDTLHVLIPRPSGGASTRTSRALESHGRRQTGLDFSV